jgi:hypothetical protein
MHAILKGNRASWSFLLLLGCSACQSKDPTSATVTRAVAPANALAVPSLPAPPDSIQLLKPFVPVGYHVLFTVAGDLNRDAWPDRVLVLDTAALATESNTDEERFQIGNIRRPLLLLLGEPSGTRYRLAARSNNVVDCRDCAGAVGGDPFQQIVVKKGYFSVESAGGSSWRWFIVTTFRYDPADQHWYLHRIGTESFQTAKPDSVTSTVKTPRDFGRVRFEQYTYNQ